MSKRLIVLSVILTLSVGLLFACGHSTEPANPNTKNEIAVLLSAPKSPATIPILRMMETNALGDKVKIDLKLYNGMEKMMTIASGEDYGFMVLPINTATTLYNKGLDIKLLNVSLWGGMYLATTDPDCNKWADLKGKQLYVPNKGSVPDIITQHFLSQHGLRRGDNIELVYSTHPEIAQLIALDKTKYAIDVEPFVTANKENNENYIVISDYVDEWKKTEGNEYSLPAFGLITNNDFSSKNKELIKTFNEEYKKALEWTLENPNEAGVLTEKHLNLDRKLIEKAMPNFKFDYKTSIDAQKDIEKYCNVLLSFKPASIGGKIPDENFYYTKK